MPPGPPVRLHRGYFLLHTNPLSPVQKEEGLREEHGFFPRRKLRRGPRFIRPPRSPEKPAPCGIAPLSRRWADRARPPPASAGVRFSAIHLPEIYGILGAPAKAQLLWGAVPQWRFRRNARDQTGRWRTNVSRRGCRRGAGEGILQPSAPYTTPTTPQSGPDGPASSPYTGEPRGWDILCGAAHDQEGEPSPAGDESQEFTPFVQKEAGFREKHGTARHGWVDSTKKRPA